VSEQLNVEQVKALQRFFEARKNAGLWKKEADVARLEVEELLGEHLTAANEFAGDNGEYIGRVRHVPGKKLDVKRLRAERPDVYAEFETETNQVRIEEPK
jgi:hypothetical protein